MNFWIFLFSKHFSNIYISLKLRHISQISSPFLSVKGVLFQLCHKSQVPNCCDGEMFLHTSQKKQRHTKLQVKQWLDPWYPLAAWRLQVGFLILCAKKKRKTKGFGFRFKKTVNHQASTEQLTLTNTRCPWVLRIQNQMSVACHSKRLFELPTRWHWWPPQQKKAQAGMSQHSTKKAGSKTQHFLFWQYSPWFLIGWLDKWWFYMLVSIF